MGAATPFFSHLPARVCYVLTFGPASCGDPPGASASPGPAGGADATREETMSPQTPGEKAVRLRPLLAFAAGHATVDIYGSFLPPLLPIFAEKLGLSLVLVGSLASIMSISDGITQPLFGIWGDRMRKPWIACVTPLVTALATGFLGLAPSYVVLATLLAISGTARSAYHPQAAAGMAEHSGARRGFFMSIFTALGNVGYATGPILATALVAVGGLSATLYAMPIGVVAAVALYVAVIRGAPERPPTWKPPAVREVLREIAGSGRALGLLLCVVILRSLTVFSLSAFLPIVLTRWGASPMETGITVSAFLYGVKSVDVTIYALAAVSLIAVSTAAALVPALRTRRMTPASVLRDE